MIVKRRDKYVLVSSTGKTLGIHPSRKAAEAQEAAINISKRSSHGFIDYKSKRR